jgi:hypothetical protein
MTDVPSIALGKMTIQIQEVNEKIHKMSSVWTLKTRDRWLRRQNTKRLEAERNKIQSKLLVRYTAIKKRMNKDVKTVQLRDKISFLVGVSNACATPVVTAKLPEWIPIYYTGQCIYLITMRYLCLQEKTMALFLF